jgi:predicted nucleotidyltransferase
VDKKIRQLLDYIENLYNVEILYACESGSRVWGFESQDSDYDIRFIYARDRDYYVSLNIEDKRDVIEYKEVPGLDFDGWDLRKALKLLKKCNPPLLEWFRSPIVYYQTDLFVDDINEVIPKYYNYAAMCYHYLHMATGNCRKYLQGDEAWLKKYFYVLRPMMSVMYLMDGGEYPPLNFETLMHSINVPDDVYDEIEYLLKLKRDGDELSRGPRIPILSDYINENLKRLRNTKFVPGNYEKSWKPLNQLYRYWVQPEQW